MTNKSYFFIALLSFIMALLLFAYQKEFIIIRIGTKKTIVEDTVQAYKKNIILFYWNNDWHTEEVPLLLSNHAISNLQQVISQWVQLLTEEKILTKKVTLQAVLMNYDGNELFISFDRVPWNKQNSTFEKWMAIEGLLKTLRTFDSTIKKVRFLISHQQMKDTHLNFTNSWPITGFIENK